MVTPSRDEAVKPAHHSPIVGGSLWHDAVILRLALAGP